jgi:hypothetical protein
MVSIRGAVPMGKAVRISFIHKWNANAASYRYRAMIPARELGAEMNDLTADVLVFAKPQPEEVKEIRSGSVVDICDDWLREYPWYADMCAAADAITCPTQEMARLLSMHGFSATVIPDPYEFAEADPHCGGNNLLWFGHGTNIEDYLRVRPQLEGFPRRAVSNVQGTIPWSIPTLLSEMARADIVIIPKYAEYKSSNRAVEAIRRGCFVVAEPHPSLSNIPGIWQGNLREGIEWASGHPQEANDRTRQAQIFVSRFRSASRISTAWKTTCEAVWDSTSAAGIGTGTDG